MTTERIAIDSPLTARQEHVAEMLSDGLSLREIADVLGVQEITVRWHLNQAAAKVPGDLPRRVRLVLWWRGASQDLLAVPAGAALRRAMTLSKATYRK